MAGRSSLEDQFNRIKRLCAALHVKSERGELGDDDISALKQQITAYQTAIVGDYLGGDVVAVGGFISQVLSAAPASLRADALLVDRMDNLQQLQFYEELLDVCAQQAKALALRSIGVAAASGGARDGTSGLPPAPDDEAVDDRAESDDDDAPGVRPSP